MSRLLCVELHEVLLGLRQPVGTSAGAHRERPVAFLAVRTEEAEGWGEVAALPEGTAVDPTLDQVWAELVQTGVPRLFEAAQAREGAVPPASQVASLFGSGPVSRMAGAALEMAVLDAELRSAGQSLAERLGAVRSRVGVGAVIGIPAERDLGTLLEEAERALAGGAGRLRVKVGPGWDEAPVAALRRAFPGLALQADANAAYRWEGVTEPRADARRLVALDEYGLSCIEQPLPAVDLPAHAALGELLATPICLDESLSTRRRMVDAIRYGACRVACLKPGRLGGLFAARQVLELCRQAEVSAFVGGFFETSLGRSANLALSASKGFDLPGDLSRPDGYLEPDPFEAGAYPATVAGWAVPSRAPGIGPVPDRARLEPWTRRRERWPVDPAGRDSRDRFGA